jgi:hypothetical protein
LQCDIKASQSKVTEDILNALLIKVSEQLNIKRILVTCEYGIKEDLAGKCRI